MRAELHASSWWDRLLCELFHRHDRWTADGCHYRRCLTFGCGMLVVTDTPLGKLRRKYRDQATAEIKRGGRVL